MTWAQLRSAGAGARAALLEQFGRYGIMPSYGAAKDGTWPRCSARLTYARTHFDSLLSDKQEVFRFLWENREALELMREAVRRPFFRLPLDYRTKQPIAILLDPVQQAREFSRLLKAESLLAEIKGGAEFERVASTQGASGLFVGVVKASRPSIIQNDPRRNATTNRISHGKRDMMGIDLLKPRRRLQLFRFAVGPAARLAPRLP